MRKSILSLFFISLTNLVFAWGERPMDAIRLYTVPKSGTHLLWKACSLLYGEYAPPQDQENKCYFHSILNGEDDYKPMPFSSDLKYLTSIRDPRDLLISHIHYFDERLKVNPNKVKSRKKELKKWKKLTFEQKLDLLVQKDPSSALSIKWIEASIAAAHAIKDKENFLIIRFEDLVGEKGGGCREKQIETLKRIVAFIDDPVDDASIEIIADKLWGNEIGGALHNWMSSDTYRKGTVGQWKEIYTKEQLEHFNKNWAHEMELLGYEL